MFLMIKVMEKNNTFLFTSIYYVTLLASSIYLNKSHDSRIIADDKLKLLSLFTSDL